MNNQSELSPWKEAVEHSKIPRVNWKLILGKSLTMYLKENKYISNEDLMKNIMLKVRDNFDELKMDGWSMPKIANNLRISISARRTEQRIYGGSK